MELINPKEGKDMSVESANELVERMKNDKNFRRKVQDSSLTDRLQIFLEEEGLEIELFDLVLAMVACMQEEETCKKTT